MPEKVWDIISIGYVESRNGQQRLILSMEEGERVCGRKGMKRNYVQYNLLKSRYYIESIFLLCTLEKVKLICRIGNINFNL